MFNFEQASSDRHCAPARWHRHTLRCSGGSRLPVADCDDYDLRRSGVGALAVAHPGVHMVWDGNAINLALIGAAWAVADSIRESRKTGPYIAKTQRRS
jgi:hypothetical protein